MSQTRKQLKELSEALAKIDLTNKSNILLKTAHMQFMKSYFTNIGNKIMYFDYSQSWVYFYIINSLQLMDVQLNQNQLSCIIQALKYCWNQKYGGFSGGYMQLPHLGTTYSAFLCILLIGPNAYHLADRDGLTKFFRACKHGKTYQMTMGGEIDLRAVYIVTIIVKLLSLQEDLLEGVAETIISSQTYEGGLANVKGGQAHGGFTFCGVAALSLLGRLHQLDIPRLTLWLSKRQCDVGGFNGRTNKLIDSCYSFWVGAIFNILNNYFQNTVSYDGHFLYSESSLERYIIFFCQESKGGIIDKPGKNRDIYHTCYALCGLALSQQNYCSRQENKLKEVDPIYNVNKEKLSNAIKYFQLQKVTQ